MGSILSVFLKLEPNTTFDLQLVLKNILTHCLSLYCSDLVISGQPISGTSFTLQKKSSSDLTMVYAFTYVLNALFSLMEKRISILVDLFLPTAVPLCSSSSPTPPHQTIWAVKSLVGGHCCFCICALPIVFCHLPESSVLPHGWLLLGQWDKCKRNS